MNTKQHIIYGLVDPDTKEIRYIGKSSYGLKRPKEHFKPSNYMKQQNHKAHWIKKLKSQGKEPDIVILKDANSEEELNLLEIETIKEYREKYGNLTNGTDGGEGSLGWVPTEENKKNMSAGRTKYLSSLTEPLKAVNKKEHQTIDGIECKWCFDCKKFEPLDLFSPLKSSWDGLNRTCRKANAARTRAYREKNPYKKLTEGELKLSYENRREKLSETVKVAFNNNPEYKEKLAKAKCKALIATSIITGEILEFESGLVAKTAGFDNTNIGKSIKRGIPYKGYIWKFKLPNQD